MKKQLVSIILVLSGTAMAAGEPSQDYQTRIVELYSAGKCSDVRKISRKVDVEKLRPNVMAIVAYCGPRGVDPEKLFTRAEALSPTGDLILVLHAKHRSKRDRASAEPLWQRVLIIARNDYFRQMAKDHLAGVIDQGDEDEPMNLSPETGFAQLFLGGSHATDVRPPDFIYLPATSSYSLLADGDLSYRRWYRFGSLAAHLTTSFDRFLTAPRFNLWKTDLELPVAVHITSNKDIIFRPLAGYSHIGGNPYRLVYGIGVAGAVYRQEYEQSVQGIVYADRIFIAPLSPQQGAHYRFQYQWDIYPQSWFLSSVLAVEHVSATPASTLFGKAGTFEMSHTDMSAAFRFERDLPKFTVGFAPAILFRVDSQDSLYTQPSTSAPISKQREDWDISLRANITVPVLPSLQLFAWYEWRKVISNIGPDDYIDRNYQDHTVGAGIKTSLSTY